MSQQVKPLSIANWFFLFILIALSVSFYQIISPFLIDIFIGILLARYFWPVFEWLKKRLSEKLAAFLTVITGLIVIIIPIFLFVLVISNEIVNRYPEIESSLPGLLENFEDSIPLVSDFLAQYNLQEKINEAAATAGDVIISVVQNAVVGTTNFIFHLIIVVFMFYYFLLDGKKLLAGFTSLIPLNSSDKKELIGGISRMSDATLRGTVIVGLIEGLFGLLLFTVFGVESALFWSVLVTIISIVPIIGSIFIYIPIGLSILFGGNFFVGLSLLILGVVGSNVIQSFIKPRILGNQSGLHPTVALVSNLGGVIWLGLIGFIIGPMIAALFVAVWNQFGRHYQRELQELNIAQ